GGSRNGALRGGDDRVGGGWPWGTEPQGLGWGWWPRGIEPRGRGRGIGPQGKSLEVLVGGQASRNGASRRATLGNEPRGWGGGGGWGLEARNLEVGGLRARSLEVEGRGRGSVGRGEASRHGVSRSGGRVNSGGRREGDLAARSLDVGGRVTSGIGASRSGGRVTSGYRASRSGLGGWGTEPRGLGVGLGARNLKPLAWKTMLQIVHQRKMKFRHPDALLAAADRSSNIILFLFSLLF
ncbi:hypothetical protein H5410_026128, partial [Solanum commersonii]